MESDFDPPTPPGRKQRKPFTLRCEARKYAWCRCEKSVSYPMCDGTHRGTGLSPLKVEFETARSVAWCACGESRAAPFCDGSHSRAP
ncbi:MAG: CDGSH iron-sulfur domain-containing protein [Planctomycetes bacterium]|nr:CDGSH iron-sulfur domain-containing protein [Planctomycetota bacterium]